MEAPKRVDEGTVPLVGQKAWQWYAAKELHDGGTKSISEIEEVIRKYADPIIQQMIDVPIEVSLRTKIPGTANFQLLCSNVIKAGQQRALAVKNLKNPTFLESFILEGRRAMPIGYREGFEDHIIH